MSRAKKKRVRVRHGQRSGLQRSSEFSYNSDLKLRWYRCQKWQCFLQKECQHIIMILMIIMDSQYCLWSWKIWSSILFSCQLPILNILKKPTCACVLHTCDQCAFRPWPPSMFVPWNAPKDHAWGTRKSGMKAVWSDCTIDAIGHRFNPHQLSHGPSAIFLAASGIDIHIDDVIRSNIICNYLWHTRMLPNQET